jgi:hypothetical protein
LRFHPADTVHRILKRARLVPYAAVDSSGFEGHHASRYFVWRTAHNKKGKEPKKRVVYKRYGKLMLIISCATHAILAAVASAGPTPDIDELDGVVDELPPSVAVGHMVGDAGFDSAHNHSLLRDYHGMRSTIPPEHGRPPKDPNALPADKYRRLMKTRFNTKAYHKRPQVETVFSMLKRNLGSALRPQSLEPVPRFAAEGDHAQYYANLTWFSTEPTCPVFFPRFLPPTHETIPDPLSVASIPDPLSVALNFPRIRSFLMGNSQNPITNEPEHDGIDVVVINWNQVRGNRIEAVSKTW